MTANEPLNIEISRKFGFPPERIFDAWLDARTAGQWLFATPNGKMTCVEIDPVVGGKFSIVDCRDGEDVEHKGEYLEIVRPSRLVFTLSVPKYSDVTTVITIEIEPCEEGCELVLKQNPVPPEFLEASREGWSMILDAQAENLSNS